MRSLNVAPAAPVTVSVDCRSAGVKKKKLSCPATPLKLSTPGVSVNVAMRYLTRNGGTDEARSRGTMPRLRAPPLGQVELLLTAVVFVVVSAMNEVVPDVPLNTAIVEHSRITHATKFPSADK